MRGTRKNVQAWHSRGAAETAVTCAVRRGWHDGCHARCRRCECTTQRLAALGSKGDTTPTQHPVSVLGSPGPRTAVCVHCQLTVPGVPVGRAKANAWGGPSALPISRSIACLSAQHGTLYPSALQICALPALYPYFTSTTHSFILRFGLAIYGSATRSASPSNNAQLCGDCNQ